MNDKELIYSIGLWKAGESQQAIAERIGVHRSTISRLQKLLTDHNLDANQAYELNINDLLKIVCPPRAVKLNYWLPDYQTAYEKHHGRLSFEISKHL